MTPTHKLKTLTSVAMLVAIGVILAEVVAISYPSATNTLLRFSIGYLPIILAGFLYGPVYGSIAGIAQDLLGFFLFQGANFHPGYTFNAMLYGLVPGLLFRKEWKNEDRIFYLVNYLLAILFLAGVVWYFFHLEDYNTRFSVPEKSVFAGIALLGTASIVLMNYLNHKKPPEKRASMKLLFMLTTLYIVTSLILTPLWIISYNPALSFWILIPVRIVKMPIDLALYLFLTPKTLKLTQKILNREE